MHKKSIIVIIAGLALMTSGCIPLIVGAAVGAGAAVGYVATDHVMNHYSVEKKK